MGIYNDFAFVYDELTKDVDYNEYFNIPWRCGRSGTSGYADA